MSSPKTHHRKVPLQQNLPFIFSFTFYHFFSSRRNFICRYSYKSTWICTCCFRVMKFVYYMSTDLSVYIILDVRSLRIIYMPVSVHNTVFHMSLYLHTYSNFSKTFIPFFYHELIISYLANHLSLILLVFNG